MGLMRQVIENSIAVVETVGTLKLAPTPVEARNIPNTKTEKVFSVTMETENTDKFRDKSPGGHMRVGHLLTVSLLCRLFPLDQMDGYNDAIDIEEQIISAMLVQSSLPTYRTLYERSRRDVLGSSSAQSSARGGGEYVLIEIIFSIEQTLPVA